MRDWITNGGPNLPMHQLLIFTVILGCLPLDFSFGADQTRRNLFWGQWREVNRKHRDVLIDKNLRLFYTPFGAVSLKWLSEEKEYFWKNSTPRTCYNTEIWLINGQIKKRDGGEVTVYAHDQVRVSLDPFDQLKVFFTDRELNDACRSYVKNKWDLTFRRLTSAEIAEVEKKKAAARLAARLAAEKETRTQSFIANAGTSDVANLKTLATMGVHPRCFEAGVKAAIASRNLPVIEWILDTYWKEAKVSVVEVWRTMDPVLLQRLISKYPVLASALNTREFLHTLIQDLDQRQAAKGTLDEKAIDAVRLVLAKVNLDFEADHFSTTTLGVSSRPVAAASESELSVLAEAALRATLDSRVFQMFLERSSPDAIDRLDRSGKTVFDYFSAGNNLFKKYCRAAVDRSQDTKAIDAFAVHVDNLQRKLDLVQKNTKGVMRQRTDYIYYYEGTTQCTVGPDGQLNFHLGLPASNLVSPIGRN